MTPATLRYLAWIDQEADPPARLSLRGWNSAARIMLTRMREALVRIEQNDASAIMEYAVAESNFNALNAWAEFSQERTGRVSLDRFSAAKLRLNKARLAVMGRARRGNGPAVVQRFCAARVPAAAKAVARTVLDAWTASTHCTFDPRIEKLQARHFKREGARSKECIKTGNWLTISQARQLPVALRKQARAAARELGFEGWFIKSDTWLADEALAHLKDRSLRQAIWQDQQNIPENDLTVRSMIMARQQNANLEGFGTYSQKALAKRAIRSPGKVLSMMSGSLDQLEACRVRFEKNLAIKASQMGIDHVEPWDRAFIIEQCNKALKPMPVDAFPVEKTLMVAIPELLALGGWTHSECIVHGSGATRSWQWRIMRKDGRRAQLWVSPFNPKNGASGTVGHMMLCRSPWSAPDMPEVEAVVGVSMAVPANHKNFEMHDLCILAHEVGHALHFLAMDHAVPDQHEAFTDDMVEFPSQLLQAYPCDPAVLARWADPAVPRARRKAEWARYIDGSVCSIDAWVHELMESWVDLAIHHEHDASQTSLRRSWLEACGRFGMDPHPLRRDYLHYFPWEGYAATNYAYPMGGFMAALFCKYRDDGTINAQAIGKNFTALLDGPLRQGVDGASFRREWRKFKGESVEVSVRRGTKLVLADVRRIGRDISNAAKKG